MSDNATEITTAVAAACDFLEQTKSRLTEGDVTTHNGSARARRAAHFSLSFTVRGRPNSIRLSGPITGCPTVRYAKSGWLNSRCQSARLQTKPDQSSPLRWRVRRPLIHYTVQTAVLLPPPGQDRQRRCLLPRSDLHLPNPFPPGVACPAQNDVNWYERFARHF